MIRQPTPDPYAWWRAALADRRTPRHEWEPQAGFYARRAVKDGPLLPVEVRLLQVLDTETGELTEPEVFEASELGRAIDPVRLWTHLRPITREEFDAITDRHRTDRRMAATHVAIDVSATPTRPTRGTAYA